MYLRNDEVSGKGPSVYSSLSADDTMVNGGSHEGPEKSEMDRLKGHKTLTYLLL
jgi:hypothetical protein